MLSSLRGAYLDRPDQDRKLRFIKVEPLRDAN
jgi:hypothetical protein